MAYGQRRRAYGRSRNGYSHRRGRAGARSFKMRPARSRKNFRTAVRRASRKTGSSSGRRKKNSKSASVPRWLRDVLKENAPSNFTGAQRCELPVNPDAIGNMLIDAGWDWSTIDTLCTIAAGGIDGNFVYGGSAGIQQNKVAAFDYHCTHEFRNNNNTAEAILEFYLCKPRRGLPRWIASSIETSTFSGPVTANYSDAYGIPKLALADNERTVNYSGFSGQATSVNDQGWTPYMSSFVTANFKIKPFHPKKGHRSNRVILKPGATLKFTTSARRPKMFGATHFPVPFQTAGVPSAKKPSDYYQSMPGYNKVIMVRIRGGMAHDTLGATLIHNGRAQVDYSRTFGGMFVQWSQAPKQCFRLTADPPVILGDVVQVQAGNPVLTTQVWTAMDDEKEQKDCISKRFEDALKVSKSSDIQDHPEASDDESDASSDADSDDEKEYASLRPSVAKPALVFAGPPPANPNLDPAQSVSAATPAPMQS